MATKAKKSEKTRETTRNLLRVLGALCSRYLVPQADVSEGAGLQQIRLLDQLREERNRLAAIVGQRCHGQLRSMFEWTRSKTSLPAVNIL